MAKVATRFAESALVDLESIQVWYAEQDVPEVGERLLGEIVASIEALADHPDMGLVVPEFDPPLSARTDPVAVSHMIEALPGASYPRTTPEV